VHFPVVNKLYLSMKALNRSEAGVRYDLYSTEMHQGGQYHTYMKDLVTLKL